MSFPIKHANIFNVDKVIKIYEEKDGVPIKYVCTTDLRQSDRPYDVFYRETPHPEFGNKYFGLTYSYENDILIASADVIEELEFAMIEDKDGNLWYSQCHHDMLVIDGNMIDGGREYVRFSGELFGTFAVKNGEFELKIKE
jgi:hypothetical protein